MTDMYDLEFAVKKLWPQKTQEERVTLMRKYVETVDHRHTRLSEIIAAYEEGRKVSETEYADPTLEKAYLMGYEAQAIEFMEAAH